MNEKLLMKDVDMMIEMAEKYHMNPLSDNEPDEALKEKIANRKKFIGEDKEGEAYSSSSLGELYSDELYPHELYSDVVYSDEETFPLTDKSESDSVFDLPASFYEAMKECEPDDENYAEADAGDSKVGTAISESSVFAGNGRNPAEKKKKADKNDSNRKSESEAVRIGENDDLLTALISETVSGDAAENAKAEKKALKKDRRQKSEAAESVLTDLQWNLADRDEKVSAIMAELMRTQEYLALVNGELYIYDNVAGCYEKCSKKDGAMCIRSLIPPEYQNRIALSEYKQAYELLTISEELKKNDDFFSFNTPLTNCQNGVYDAVHDILLPKSPKYSFTNCLEARFDPDAKHKKWDEYLDYITGGDHDLKRLWRVILGYLFSNYTNAKCGILVYGIPHTGKSVLCNLIERFFGSRKVSHVDISMFCRPEFAAHTAGKVLNVVPDLKNEKLSDVGFLKSLLSHLDKITTRGLYRDPQEISCQTKMIFSTNHLLSFDVKTSSKEDIEAVFNRLTYVPFENSPIPKSKENKHLAEELWEERDGILTWALRSGLREYLDLGENFPRAEKSEELKAHNASLYCPEMAFCRQYIVAEEGACASSRDIRDAYSAYCFHGGIQRTRKLDILTYLENHYGAEKVHGRFKKKDEDKNCWHYKNLKLLWEDGEEDDGEYDA